MSKKRVACIGNFTGRNAGKLCGQISPHQKRYNYKSDRVLIREMIADFRAGRDIVSKTISVLPLGKRRCITPGCKSIMGGGGESCDLCRLTVIFADYRKLYEKIP